MNRRLIFRLSFLILLSSCSNSKQTNEINEKKQDAAIEVAEASNCKVSELPLGFNFGMTEKEVNNHIDSLLRKRIISTISKGNQYEYICTTKKGVKVMYRLKFGFYEDALYLIKLTAMNEDVHIAKAIENELNSTLGPTYTKIGYWKDDGTDSKIFYNMWFKSNQIIFLRIDDQCCLFYKNAPIYKIVSEKRVNQAISVTRKIIYNYQVFGVNNYTVATAFHLKENLIHNLAD